ncbi:MAG: hypothetical protein JRG97_07525 [Deltaproteobacteria bacterium]|nr:hypothetical protein [Deltaproteobacteria bacterium]MBW2050801.1 hypothetical protein [Deltaproteobacteria bacterium]MBW2140907.1 hypothetical protein [Deltaproteobacteria bacterium]MBW2322668.1 hypothetical protein [Deltaproteobacteria bacterium]
MKNLLEHNLASLEKHDNDLAGQIRSAPDLNGASVKPAKNGHLTLIINGISMHSRVDPVGEAERLASSAPVNLALSHGLRLAVFGLGMGYHVKALAGKLDEIWVIEPNLGMIRLAFSYLDFSAFVEKLHFVLVQPTPVDWPKTILLPHPPSRRLAPKNYETWAAFFDGDKERGLLAGALKETCADQSVIDEILPGIDTEKKAGLTQLAHHIESQEGFLTEAEAMILLLNELARAS